MLPRNHGIQTSHFRDFSWAITRDARLVEGRGWRCAAIVASRCRLHHGNDFCVQHAQTHMKAVAAYVPNDSKESRNAMLLLVDQSAGLESERITLEREWAVWQVQYNGLKPEETDLIFSRTPGNDPDC